MMTLPWTWTCLENPWRPNCDRWWLHWLKFPLNLYHDLRRIYERGTRGHGRGDVGDLNDYAVVLMVNCLTQFKASNCAYPHDLTPEEWDAKLDLMIDGWKAMHELLSSADEPDYTGPESMPAVDAWRDSKMDRWQKGMTEFTTHYASLWI